MHSLTIRAAFLAAALSTPALCQNQLTTTFASNNGGGAGWTNLFDLTANTPLAITQLDVHLTTAGQTGTLDVYMTAAGGTYAGNERIPALWTLVSGGAPFSSLGRGTPTPVPLADPILVQPGRYGVAIVFNGASQRYTDGNATYSDAHLRLDLGSVVTTALGGNLYGPRTWNGTIHYVLGHDVARATRYGDGCGGTFPAGFYETFGSSSPFDLQGSGFTMNYVGGFYAVIPTATPIVTPGGSPLAIGDDQTIPVNLPWNMPYQSGATPTIRVCSNGWIALESTTSTDLSESVADLQAGPPRICPMWDDLDPTISGTVHAEQDPVNPGLFHVTWTGVPETASSGTNTFQVTFSSAGTIEVKYGACAIGDCLVGYALGGDVPLPATGTDLSAATPFAVSDGRPDLELGSVSRPVLGTTAAFETRHIPPGSLGGVVLFGLAPVAPGVDLGVIGAPGCAQHATIQAQLGLPTAAPSAQLMLPVPNTPALSGAHLFLQSLVVKPGINPLGIVTSNGLDWRLAAQ